MKTPYASTFHRDGTVTLWNAYTQTWLRSAAFSDEVLASLGQGERERVIRHCKAEVGFHRRQALAALCGGT